MSITVYTSGLYFIPTPIGNLEDITIRALRLFSAADIIACEDTRVTGQLLKQYKITPKQLVKCHEHNEKSISIELCKAVQQGKIVCYCSDAGMPLMSDPGHILLQTAIEYKILYTVLPGPSALLPALAMSGFSTESFTFLGFPPHKKGRKTFIDSLESYLNTIILYESPHRLLSLLEDLSTHHTLKNRKLYIVREISKKFEQGYFGLPIECLDMLISQGVKGEFVVVLSDCF